MNYISIAIFVLLIINILVTIKLLGKKDFEKNHKIAQAIIIWILPLLGATLIYVFLKSDEEPRGPKDPPFGDGPGHGGYSHWH